MIINDNKYILTISRVCMEFKPIQVWTDDYDVFNQYRKMTGWSAAEFFHRLVNGAPKLFKDVKEVEK